MAEYKISSLLTTDAQGKGTSNDPFKISVGINFTTISKLTLGDAYVKFDNDKMFQSAGSLVEVNGGHINTYDCSGMFSGCTNLTAFTASLTNPLMRGIVGDDTFHSCGLKTITHDWSLITSAKQMYYDCGNLEEIHGDFSFITDATSMFQLCSSLSVFDFNDYDTSVERPTFRGLLTADNMFSTCTSLTSFACDFRVCSSVKGMFEYCTSLQSVKTTISGITDISNMSMMLRDTRPNEVEIKIKQSVAGTTTADAMFDLLGIKYNAPCANYKNKYEYDTTWATYKFTVNNPNQAQDGE